MHDQHAASPGDEAAARGVDQQIQPDAPTTETVSDETNAPVEIPDAAPGSGLLDDPGPGGDIYTGGSVAETVEPEVGPEGYAAAVGAEPEPVNTEQVVDEPEVAGDDLADPDEDEPQPERRPELRDI